MKYLHVLLAGGEDKNTSFNVVEKYDPKCDTWTYVPSMRQKRAGAGVAVCDGKIYIAGTGRDVAQLLCYSN